MAWQLLEGTGNNKDGSSIRCGTIRDVLRNEGTLFTARASVRHASFPAVLFSLPELSQPGQLATTSSYDLRASGMCSSRGTRGEVNKSRKAHRCAMSDTQSQA